MKITVWMLTRERETWITSAEVLALAFLLYWGPGATIRLLVGLPLLAHVGYRALTGLPMGEIPGRPEGGKQRSQYDLRASIKSFLSEVRRVEDYAQRGRLAGWSRREMQGNLQTGQKKIMAAAAQVAKATGRPPREPAPSGEPASATG